MLQQVVVSLNADPEGQRIVVVEHLLVHLEQVPEGRRAVRKNTRHRVRVEPIVLSKWRRVDRGAELVRLIQDRVSLRVVVDVALTSDEDMGATGVRGIVDSSTFFRCKVGCLCNLQFLLTVANTLEVVLAIDAVGTDSRCLGNRDDK